MNASRLFAFFLLFALSLSLAASAANETATPTVTPSPRPTLNPDETHLDFGTMQQGNSGQVLPGQTLSLSSFFFVDSEYGNRITHITLRPRTLPDGWTMTFDPALHDVTLNISGSLTTIKENVYADPRPVLSAIPNPPEPGIEYLVSPSGRGYLQARKVTMLVTVPKDAPVGQTFDVVVEATAKWYGFSGTVILNQQRDFVYKVTVASDQPFREEVLPGVVTAQPSGAPVVPTAAPSSPASTVVTVEKPADQTLLIALGAVVLLLVGYIVATRKK